MPPAAKSIEVLGAGLAKRNDSIPFFLTFQERGVQARGLTL
jgi:hypothetical protein